MDDPLISLALPIMNGLPGLRRAMDALQEQKYRNFELVVQDGGSTDGSLEYLRELNLPRVDILSEPDTGIGQAYNRAFARCRGPLVVALACDEWLEKDALETFAGWYREHPNAAFCYGGQRCWKNLDDPPFDYHPGKFDSWRFIMSECNPTSGGYYNKEIIGSDFYYDETLRSCPDFDFFIRLGLRFGPLEIVNKPVIVYNVMTDRSSQTYRPESFPQFARDRLHILQRFFAEQGSSPLLNHLRNVAISSMYVHLAYNLLDLVGETPEVHRYILEAVRHNPTSPKIADLLRRSRELFQDEATGQIFRRRSVQPARPPDGAMPIEGIVDIRAASSEEEWLSAGAAVTVSGAVVRVETSWIPWSCAARIPIRFPENAGPGWHWIELSLAVRSGKIGLALVTADGRVKGERLVSAAGPQTTLVLPLSPSDRAVLFRNAAVGGPSQVDLLQARVLRVAARSESAPDGAETGPRFPEPLPLPLAPEAAA